MVWYIRWMRDWVARTLFGLRTVYVFRVTPSRVVFKGERFEILGRSAVAVDTAFGEAHVEFL